MANKKTKVHFIGINGSGISGAACIAKNRGFEVNGCDLSKTGDYSVQLAKNNIKVSVGHSVEHIKDADLVVLSPALLYKDKYKQIEETRIAMETKKTMKWQEFLGSYIMNKQNIIAVSGTHGKTTTTSLVSLILEKDDFDPTVFVGGVVKEWNQTYRIGDSDCYICEADEYDGNFLNYYPRYIAINNLEMEHPEIFKDFDGYKENFKNFIKTIQDNGKIVFFYDDNNILNLLDSLSEFISKKNIKLIGYTFNTEFKNVPENIKIILVKNGQNSITISNQEIGHKLVGEHNVKNISMASVLALEVGVKINSIKSVLENFTGSKRRMDLVFSNEKIKLYDDYAHHHTQVDYTLKALKDNLQKNEKLIAVLEPHLISRIKNNTEDYKKALLMADFPIVTKIFKSRESFIDDIDIKGLLNNDKIEYIEDHDDVIERVKNIVKSDKNNNYVIAVMGAGNSYKIANSLKSIF